MTTRAFAPALLALLCLGLPAGALAGGPTLPPNWDDRYLDRAGNQQDMKTAVAVLPFEVASGARSVDLKMADIVTTSLFKSGRFEIVERSKIEAIVAEQKLKLSGAIDDASQVAEVGKLLGAEAVVVGTLTVATQQRFDKFAYDLIETEVRIDVRAIDTSTGKVIFSESSDGKSEAKIVTTAKGVVISGALDTVAEFNKAAASAAGNVGKKLGSLFPVVGYVIAVNGPEILTDVGGDRGVDRGDHLVVFRAGERLVHPVTKKPLGWRKQVLGLLKVQSVDRTSSTTAVDDGDAASLQPGDVVVLRPRS